MSLLPFVIFVVADVVVVGVVVVLCVVAGGVNVVVAVCGVVGLIINYNCCICGMGRVGVDEGRSGRPGRLFGGVGRRLKKGADKAGMLRIGCTWRAGDSGWRGARGVVGRLGGDVRGKNVTSDPRNYCCMGTRITRRRAYALAAKFGMYATHASEPDASTLSYKGYQCVH